jgi:hypothetical protein
MTVEPNSDERTIRVDVRRVTLTLILTCLALEVGLVLADAIINYGKLTELSMIRRLFNITREDSLASWFGVTQTWMVALTAWLTYLTVRTATSARRRRAGWLIVALFFTYMAVDDGAEIHERLGSAYKAIYQPEQSERIDAEGVKLRGLTYYPSYPWHLLFLPLFAAAAIFMVLFLRREMDDRRARAMVWAAILLFVAAVALDFVEGLAAEHPLNLHSMAREGLHLSRYEVRHFSKAFEEFFEMFGMTLLWAAFLRNLAGQSARLGVRFVNC